MSVNVIYTTRATATGGRDGRAKTYNGTLDVKLVKPKEMGGNGDAGNNPEELFAAGYGATKFVAGQSKIAISDDATVTAHVGFGPRDAGGFGLEISLDISLPGLSKDEATALVEKAHQVCPYSNATRGNIDVKLNVI
jgi:lipoyl-dependent peroxiredoxin